MQHLISIIAVISWLKMILIYIFPLVLWVAWDIPQLDFLLINHLLAHQLRLKVPDDLSPLSSRSLKGNSA